MRTSLGDLLATHDVLLADGATGTNYFQRGLTSGHPPELWNVEHPEHVQGLHREFVEAGADIILTNTFGGTRHRLKLHGLDTRVREVNRRAAEIAREVADAAGRKVIVGGSVGPTGELFAPLGALTHDDAVDAFAEQMEGLKAGGAEIAWIETMSAPEEIRAAAEAAIRVGLPYVCTASFDTAGRTMMGLAPKDMPHVADGLAEAPLAVGANCGVGASDILVSALDMTAADPAATVVVKGNCGIPEYRGAEIFYSGTPDLMAEYTRLAVDAGARIIGGCCGTSYGHLAAMRHALDAHRKAQRPTVEEIVDKIGPLRNKTAAESGGGERRERRGRRGQDTP